MWVGGVSTPGSALASGEGCRGRGGVGFWRKVGIRRTAREEGGGRGGESPGRRREGDATGLAGRSLQHTWAQVSPPRTIGETGEQVSGAASSQRPGDVH